MGAKERNEEAAANAIRKVLGGTEELTEAQKKQRQEGEKYVKTLIDKANALKLENKAMQLS